MTLTELFEQHHRPHLHNHKREQRTIDEYRNTLRYWEQATGHAEVSEIDVKNIVQFKDYLAGLPGKKTDSKMAGNTIRKHLRTIHALLTTAAPKDSHNKRGIGLIAEVPELAPPAEEFRDAVDMLTREEIIAWIQAAKVRKASPIGGIDSAVWWECLIKVLYNTGIRIGTALNLRWSWIDFDSGVIHIKKCSGVKTAYTAVLNDEAREALRRLQASGFRLQEETERILKSAPADRVFDWRMNIRTLYSIAERQQIMAGIPEHRRFKFHGIRKHFGSGIAAENSGVATKALGHSNPTVTLRYYTNPRQVVAPAVDRIKPLKECLTPATASPCDDDPCHQRNKLATVLPVNPLESYFYSECVGIG